ncbi:MAG TPA: hypothetical protein VEG35_04835, partial [Burkholderiales bacterium]|nr:hypothetical protein [Burkholderiales bacterium]
IFGGPSGPEERRGRALFRKVRARGIPSDRFRLLAAEAEGAARAKGGTPAPAPERGGTLE